MTEPLDETPTAPTQQIAVRFPPDLLTAMDARAKDVSLSRNAWMVKSLTWVLTYLPTGIKAPLRDQVATEAPDDVTGTRRELGETASDRAKRLRKTEIVPDKDGVVEHLDRKDF